MDERRLSTSNILSMGMLKKEPPKTDIPENRKTISSGIGNDGWIGDGRALKVLNEGMIIETCEYYGIPRLWKEKNKYRGVLLQYCSVSEDKTFTDINEALDWFKDVSELCMG